MTHSNREGTELGLICTVSVFYQMVFLPEACDYIADSKEQSIDMAESLDGDLVSRYCDTARQHQLWLSIGGFHQKVAMTVYVSGWDGG